MEKILHQKKFQEFKKYTINSEFLEVEIKSFTEYHKFNIKYEDIGFETYTTELKLSSGIVYLCVSILINIVLIICLLDIKYPKSDFVRVSSFCLFFLLIALNFYFYKDRSRKIIQGKYNIDFYYDTKQRCQEVDQFIADMKEAKRNYIRNKYFLLDELLSLEELEYQFKWLYRDKYISKSEYDLMMEELQAKRLF